MRTQLSPKCPPYVLIEHMFGLDPDVQAVSYGKDTVLLSFSVAVLVWWTL